jgi:uncharacterized protein
MPASQIRRAQQHLSMPWKNGGGVTHELAVSPPGAGFDDFVWRASIAEVNRDGPFSVFGGIDRTLVLLDGAGFTLYLDQTEQHNLDLPYQPFRFSGERAVSAHLRDGPTRDFNLMIRRAQARGRLDIERGPDAADLDAEVALVYCERGTVDLSFNSNATTDRLRHGDLLQIDPAETGLWHMQPSTDAILLVIRITPLISPGASL